MWTCPKCQQQFVNTNQWHSCNQNTVSNFLEGKSKKSLELYHLLMEAFSQFGPFELHPAKTRIALNNRMRFAAINRLGKDFLTGHLVLDQRQEQATCFFRIDSVTKKAHVHHFKIFDRKDLNAELLAFMKMTYQLGEKS